MYSTSLRIQLQGPNLLNIDEKLLLLCNDDTEPCQPTQYILDDPKTRLCGLLFSMTPSGFVWQPLCIV